MTSLSFNASRAIASIMLWLLLSGSTGCVGDVGGKDPAEDSASQSDLTATYLDSRPGTRLDGGQGKVDTQEAGHEAAVPGKPDSSPEPDSYQEPESYQWYVGGWQACSAQCDGGTRTREVYCQDSKAQQVDDSFCTGTKPKNSETCNTQPCCATATLQSSRECDGDAKVQWTHWGDDTGDAADRASCADQCTAWARGQGYQQWCCRLYEDSSAGTNWVCRGYDSYSTTASSSINFAGLGQCL